jgi:hypothetical protein
MNRGRQKQVAVLETQKDILYGNLRFVEVCSGKIHRAYYFPHNSFSPEEIVKLRSFGYNTDLSLTNQISFETFFDEVRKLPEISLEDFKKMLRTNFYAKSKFEYTWSYDTKATIHEFTGRII